MTGRLSTDPHGWKAWIQYHLFHFKGPAGTSRGTLTEKPVYYFCIQDEDTRTTGIGECSTLSGLSPEHGAGYEKALQQGAEALSQARQSPEALYQAFTGRPSIQFGLEQAFYDWANGGKRILFASEFTRGQMGIPINGLIWMNDIPTMREAIHAKIREGFSCLKLKIGARKWEDELGLLSEIRAQFSPDQLQVRVDANGAFSPDNALNKLAQLAELGIHSIEQPLPANAWEATANLCEQAPVPIALDETLIGHFTREAKTGILDKLKPRYIILKPSLLGGIRHANEWIELANNRGIGWWVTSALESNIGLNAIAQWTATLPVNRPQGLGTGGLYTNNIPAPLTIDKAFLYYKPSKSWDLGIVHGQ